MADWGHPRLRIPEIADYIRPGRGDPQRGADAVGHAFSGASVTETEFYEHGQPEGLSMVAHVEVETDLTQRLTESLLPPDVRAELNSGLPPRGKMKVIILFAPRFPSEGLLPLPLQPATLTALKTQFKLPIAPEVLVTGMASFHWKRDVRGEKDIEHIIIQDNATTVHSCSTSLTYNKATRSTTAIIFGAEEEEAGDITNVLRSSTRISHWLSLAIVLLRTHGWGWTRKIQAMHDYLWEIENSVGMRLWLADQNEVDIKTKDLAQLHKVLNSVFVQLAMYDLVCQTRLGLIKRLQKYCEQGHAEMGIDEEDKTSMVQELDYLQSWYEGIQARSTYLTRRAETQLQTVYSMVSQRDSAINLEIAQLSRHDNISTREIAIAAAKDSATMRVIAYVTLAFLPATFVATFFSTSFFDFKPSGRVSWWLWLYFVLSAPLTGAVLVLWRHISKKKEKELLSKIPSGGPAMNDEKVEPAP